MLETPTVESSTMIAEGGTTMVVNQKKNGFPNMEKKHEEGWYTYCNKPRHTREKCWKLHGKPPKLRMGAERRSKKRGSLAWFANFGGLFMDSNNPHTFGLENSTQLFRLLG